MNAINQKPANVPNLGDQAPQLEADIQALIDNRLQLDSAQSSAQHTRIIMDLHRLIAYVANESGLNIDPDVAAALTSRALTNNVLMAAEYAGRARGLGTGIATEKALTPDARIRLGEIMATLTDNKSAMQDKLAHIRTVRNSLLAPLDAAIQEPAQTLQDLTHHVPAFEVNFAAGFLQW